MNLAGSARVTPERRMSSFRMVAVGTLGLV